MLMKIEAKEQRLRNIAIALGFIIIVLAIIISQNSNLNIPRSEVSNNNNPLSATSKEFSVKSFEDSQDFVSYLSSYKTSSYGYGITGNPLMTEGQAKAGNQETGMLPTGIPSQASQPSQLLEMPRYSLTNVQVLGVDEADILKVDSENAYFVNNGFLQLFKAYPATEFEKVSELQTSSGWQTWRLIYLKNKELIAISYKSIKAFDVSNIENPEELWALDLNDSYIDSRLVGNWLYVITSSNARYFHGCPIRTFGGVIPCNRIYYPVIPSQVDNIYTLTSISINTAKIKNSLSFTGNGRTIIYTSPKNFYVSYNMRKSYQDVLYYMLLNYGKELLPNNLVEKIKKLSTYDISEAAKSFETMRILQFYLQSLTQEQKEQFMSNLQKTITDHWDHISNYYDSTGIVKIGFDNGLLAIKSTGLVPGHLLNQFSMDEYEDTLRLATTLNNIVDSSKTTNSVYVLDKNLDILSSLKDFKQGETIYSVRFLRDRGYVVTFKRTDPLFVLDLSNPYNVKLAGSLEMLGYSSYLHPIDDYKLLGIGKEGSHVKVSLFDVSDPENPKELDRFIMQAYWSDVLNNHHAFLWDAANRIAAIPAGHSYYLFRINNDSITLKKLVNMGWSPLRAAYIDNFIYAFSNNQAAVVDEETFNVIKTLNIQTSRRWKVYEYE